METCQGVSQLLHKRTMEEVIRGADELVCGPTDATDLVDNSPGVKWQCAYDRHTWLQSSHIIHLPRFCLMQICSSTFPPASDAHAVRRPSLGDIVSLGLSIQDRQAATTEWLAPGKRHRKPGRVGQLFYMSGDRIEYTCIRNQYQLAGRRCNQAG